MVEPVAVGAEPVEPAAEEDGAAVADPIGEPACDPTDAAAGPAPEADPDPDHESEETELAEDAEPLDEPAPEPRPTRHTVFTARYRLAIKGPERGKWDVEVVEEADAPMVTVEAVVRGVQRRAGDEGDPPERLDASAVARLVGAAAPP